MLRIKKVKKTTILLFNTQELTKGNILSQFLVLSYMGVAIYFLSNESFFKIMGILYSLLVVLSFIEWEGGREITEIFLDEKKINVFRKKIYKAKKRKIFSLEYKNIKEMEMEHIGTRLSLYGLNIITNLGKKHRIITTPLKGDIEKIIEIYNEKKFSMLEDLDV